MATQSTTVGDTVAEHPLARDVLYSRLEGLNDDAAAREVPRGVRPLLLRALPAALDSLGDQLRVEAGR